ncbi:MAG: hypothetical protein WKF31_01395 [Thermoleophilaceae bacterium]
MATVVVKLGSSIVADERGDVRTDVVGRVCEDAAALHHAGDSVVLVTSGAIARGMREMAMPARPRTIDELQAASAVGQGKLYRTYDELLRAHGVPSAQVLLTFFDMSARTHYLNVAADPAQAGRVARGAGHQRERHHHHRRDLVRGQRLPGRAGGHPPRRRRAAPAHGHRGTPHRRPSP